MYSVVCDTGNAYVVVESFISRIAAERFVREMQDWFAIPLKIKKFLRSGTILVEKRGRTNT